MAPSTLGIRQEVDDHLVLGDGRVSFRRTLPLPEQGGHALQPALSRRWTLTQAIVVAPLPQAEGRHI